MKTQVIWIAVSTLVILSLLSVLSCAPTPTATPTTTAPTTAPVTTAPATTTPTAAPAADKPKYGGILTLARLNDSRGFDQVYLTTGWAENSQTLTNDRLLIGDWTIGPAGSNKTDFSIPGWMPEGVFRETGSLAESWEVPDDQTIIFKIRQGVRFQNKPPVNGREMDANDVVFSISYMYLNPKLPAAYNIVSSPAGKRLLSAKTIDKWTVEVKVEAVAWGFLEDLGVKGIHIVPHEVIEKYGDLKDWHNAVGTGGFMLTDYVPGSSFTYVRNPNYWMRNPVGPGKGDQLPYIDGIKELVILDKSTVQAAFRTGKLDLIGEFGHTVTYEDFQGLLRTNPQIQSKVYFEAMKGVGIRLASTDPLAKPLLNQRVRWALSMAIDREAMIRDYYQGAATKYIGFFPPNSPYYRTPDQMPEILEKAVGIKPEDAAMVKKIFEYNPDEAKKILAEEGYPNGFKTVVITAPVEVDFLSILKEYWSRIRVDMDIDARQREVYTNVIDKHETQAMFFYAPGWISTNPAKFIYLGPGDPTLPFTVSNRTELSHPVLDDYIQGLNAIYGFDLSTQARLLQESEAWVMWMAPYILTPSYNNYTAWHPWLKNYYGFEAIGFRGHKNFAYFAWIDQELKKSMGY